MLDFGLLWFLYKTNLCSCHVFPDFTFKRNTVQLVKYCTDDTIALIAPIKNPTRQPLRSPEESETAVVQCISSDEEDCALSNDQLDELVDALRKLQVFLGFGLDM